jgi:inner membrane protein
MDSVTQIALGAAVGEATLGSRVGKKAPLWGAALGTLPDLDVLANPFVSEVTALAIHRGFTHSLLFIVLATPLFGALLHRLHANDNASARSWSVLVFLTLATHVLLDCLTSYGTQVFYPFSDYAVILGTIFVIDPLYTVPLLVGLGIALMYTPGARRRRVANYVGLGLSSLYMLLTVANKLHVNAVFDDALARQGLDMERVFTKPMPLTNVLWSAIAEDSTGYWIGYYSLFDESTQIDFHRVPKNHDLLDDAWNSAAVQRLRWFSRGYFTVSQRDGHRYVHDLRFGRSDFGVGIGTAPYVFTFRLTEGRDGDVTGFRQTDPAFSLDTETVKRYFARVAGTESVTTASR